MNAMAKTAFERFCGLKIPIMYRWIGPTNDDIPECNDKPECKAGNFPDTGNTFYKCSVRAKCNFRGKFITKKFYLRCKNLIYKYIVSWQYREACYKFVTIYFVSSTNLR